jgi:hypothetical protein
MPHETWGTFSVRDHCGKRPFFAEVLLYDRLVVPVPPNDAEVQRWEKNGWQPERQKQLVALLGERVVKVPWDAHREESWRKRFEAGKAAGQQTQGYAFQATRTELTAGLPAEVTGVEAIASYPTFEELRKDLQLTDAMGGVAVPSGAAVAVLGQEFLVPDDPKASDTELLTLAVSLSSEPEFRRKRRAFWRWQREFVGREVLTSQASVHAAVEEMSELIADEQKAIRRENLKCAVRSAFLLTTVTLGIVGGPLTPFALGGAFVSIGQYVADALLSDPPAVRSSALFHDVKKHFGWK